MVFKESLVFSFKHTRMALSSQKALRGEPLDILLSWPRPQLAAVSYCKEVPLLSYSLPAGEVTSVWINQHTVSKVSSTFSTFLESSHLMETDIVLLSQEIMGSWRRKKIAWLCIYKIGWWLRLHNLWLLLASLNTGNGTETLPSLLWMTIEMLDAQETYFNVRFLELWSLFLEFRHQYFQNFIKLERRLTFYIAWESLSYKLRFRWVRVYIPFVILPELFVTSFKFLFICSVWLN